MAAARSISAERTSIPPAPPDAPLIRSMEDLVAALRNRRAALQITCETLDHIAGFPSGYSAKLLAPVAIKNLGWMSLGAALDSMAVGLVLVENAEQRRKVERRWTRRERPNPQAGKQHALPRLHSSRK